MQTKPRYINESVLSDLSKKMVFIGGPRQVGKTTLALSLLGASATEEHKGYFNWDKQSDRKSILSEKMPAEQKLIILDEIHKYKKWRGLVKGLYDTSKSRYSYLVTGSARLDHYRKGGDSLQGRYHYHRLHPLSAGELINSNQKFNIERLLKYGGFPEPYFAQNQVSWQRWQNERATRVLREDLRDLKRVQEISLLEQLYELLPSKIGSPLSIKNLSSELEVAHKTVSRWLLIFENLYITYRVAPFGDKKIRAVKKEQKLYLWDWSLLLDPGPRFENLVASQLLKHCHRIEDSLGQKMELRYIRDTDKREVDFVVLQNGKPQFAVECKLQEAAPSPHLRYFSERIKIPKWYQVHLGEEHFVNGQIECLPFLKFVEKEKLP